MTPTTRKICGVFATSSFNFDSNLFCFVLFLRAVFYKSFFKSRGKLFDFGVATVMSTVTHMLYGVHGVDTMSVRD